MTFPEFVNHLIEKRGKKSLTCDPDEKVGRKPPGHPPVAEAHDLADLLVTAAPGCSLSAASLFLLVVLVMLRRRFLKKAKSRLESRTPATEAPTFSFFLFKVFLLPWV